MSIRSNDANTWYQTRDDRTKRVPGVTINKDYSVGVLVDRDVVSSCPTQIMSLIALNILSRWCRNVTIDVPDDTICILPISKGQNLSKMLLGL